MTNVAEDDGGDPEWTAYLQRQRQEESIDSDKLNHSSKDGNGKTISNKGASATSKAVWGKHLLTSSGEPP